MEGHFLVRFDDKEAYNEGLVKTLDMLEVWKEKESSFDRDYDLTPIIDEEKNIFNLAIKLNVEER